MKLSEISVACYTEKSLNNKNPIHIMSLVAGKRGFSWLNPSCLLLFWGEGMFSQTNSHWLTHWIELLVSGSIAVFVCTGFNVCFTWHFACSWSFLASHWHFLLEPRWKTGLEYIKGQSLQFLLVFRHRELTYTKEPSQRQECILFLFYYFNSSVTILW